MSKKLNPKEKIIESNGLTVGDFWSWAYSDVMSNVNRSAFAEFMVASALDVIEEPRKEWDAYDLVYKGKKIEVKASAYIQSWPQEDLSVIRFDIGKKLPWHADTNTWEEEPIRAADCYVFCLYPETNRDKANILDVDAWEFYVLPTEQINQELGEQKSIGLKKLQAMCESIGYDELKGRVNKALGFEGNP